MSRDLLREHLALVRRELRQEGRRPRKRLGQHFLLDARLLRRIAEALGDLQGRTVVEIGPGPGGLTAALLCRGARVLALELDESWASFTEQALGSHRLEVRCADARAGDGALLERLLGDLHRQSGRRPLLAGNLPYQIASPLLVDLVRGEAAPARAVVMVQREVATRLTAPPGASERGLLTLLVGLRADVRTVLRVRPGSFVPPPRVESTVVEIVPDPRRRARVDALPALEDLLRLAFAGRRKMLRRSLLGALPEGARQELGEDLLRRRPQDLEDAEWLRLAGKAGPAASRRPC